MKAYKSVLLFVAVSIVIPQAVYGEFVPPEAVSPTTDLVADATKGNLELSGHYVCRDIRIDSGAKIQLPSRNGILDATISLECREFTLASGGSCESIIQVPWSSNYKAEGCRNGHGGSYGGRGRESITDIFGTVSGLDISHGRPGGIAGDCVYPHFTSYGSIGSPPGGALTIKADTVTIAGTLSCNGVEGVQEDQYGAWGGGGSGGGILILARSLDISGNTHMTVNGGLSPPGTIDPSAPINYNGGGGRIKIFYEQGSIASESTINAIGYQDGTIWIQRVASLDQLLNPSADLNLDGHVDSADAFVLMSQWQDSTPTVTPRPTRTPVPTWTSRPTRTPWMATMTPTLLPTPTLTVTPAP